MKTNLRVIENADGATIRTVYYDDKTGEIVSWLESTVELWGMDVTELCDEVAKLRSAFLRPILVEETSEQGYLTLEPKEDE